MRLLPNKTLLTIAIVMALCAILCYLLKLDDPLSKETLVLLQKEDVPSNDEGYFYLMGIMAAENEEPITVGKKQFKSIQQAESTYQATMTFTYSDYDSKKKLPIPQGNLFCKPQESNCYSMLFISDPEPDLKKHLTLLNRYKFFSTLSSDHIPTQATVNEPLPSYHYLIQGLRLFILENVNLAQQGQPETARNNLQQHSLWIRQRLEHSPNLISKMVYTAMLAQTIDVIYLLQKQYSFAEYVAIPELTKREMDMTKALKREFEMGYNLFKLLDQHPNMFSTENRIPKFLLPLTRLIYKPNMTINLIAKEFDSMIKISELEKLEFTQKLINNRVPDRDLSFRNIIGNKLATIGGPDYLQYQARIYNLNQKIRMYNTAVDNPIKWLNTSIYNPYWELSETPTINDGWVCIKAVKEDDRKYNCLPN